MEITQLMARSRTLKVSKSSKKRSLRLRLEQK